MGAAVTAAVERFGRIDGLFSVAGGSGRRFGDGPIHTVTGDAWEATAALNLRTQVLVCAAVTRQMLDQAPNDSGTRGSILLMGSVTTSDPAPELFATHAYAAAKGALTALMTTMAATYAPDGIRVNIVAPSLTRTPMAQRAATDADDPRLRPPEAAARRRDARSRRGRQGRRLLPVGRVACRHRADAQGRWRLVGDVRLARARRPESEP